MIKYIEKAIKKLIIKDNKILEANLKEECINHIIANYIKEKIIKTKYSKYKVDIEYNKITSTGLNKHLFTKNIRPDIIIHMRDDNPSNNLCVLEIKKNYCLKSDKRKIIDLIQSNLAYQFGYCISLKLKQLSGPNITEYRCDNNCEAYITKKNNYNKLGDLKI
jgi:hypothetical protein